MHDEHAASDVSFYRQAVPTVNADPRGAAAELIAAYISNTTAARGPPSAVHSATTAPSDIERDDESTAAPDQPRTPPPRPETPKPQTPAPRTPDPPTPQPPTPQPPTPEPTNPAPPSPAPSETIVSTNGDEGPLRARKEKVSELLRSLRGETTPLPALARTSSTQSKNNGFAALLNHCRTAETTDTSADATREAVAVTDDELDARQRWLAELTKLQTEYKVKLSKDHWTMQDTARAMQYEVRKAYQGLLMQQRKNKTLRNIRMFGSIVKYGNVLLRLNLPGLADYDVKVQSVLEDPVTLYKLDEMHNLHLPIEPEDPKFYLAKQLLWPLAAAILLKIIITVFRPYLDVDELMALVNRPAPREATPRDENKAPAAAGGFNILRQVMNTFTNSQGASGKPSRPRNPPTKGTERINRKATIPTPATY